MKVFFLIVFNLGTNTSRLLMSSSCLLALLNSPMKLLQFSSLSEYSSESFLSSWFWSFIFVKFLFLKLSIGSEMQKRVNEKVFFSSLIILFLNGDGMLSFSFFFFVANISFFWQEIGLFLHHWFAFWAW